MKIVFNLSSKKIFIFSIFFFKFCIIKSGNNNSFFLFISFLSFFHLTISFCILLYLSNKVYPPSSSSDNFCASLKSLCHLPNVFSKKFFILHKLLYFCFFNTIFIEQLIYLFLKSAKLFLTLFIINIASFNECSVLSNLNNSFKINSK